MNQDNDLQELIGEHGVLLGCCIDSASPGIAEMPGMLGFHFVWADLEHLSVDLALAENFCSGGGGGRRTAYAADCGRKPRKRPARS